MPTTGAWIALRDWIDSNLTEFGMSAEQLLEAEAFVEDIELEAAATPPASAEADDPYLVEAKRQIEVDRKRAELDLPPVDR